MFVEKLTEQDVVRELRSMNSSDPHALMAVKEVLLSETRRFKPLAFLTYIGILLSITVVLAPIGLPLWYVGHSVEKAIYKNEKTIELAYIMYSKSL